MSGNLPEKRTRVTFHEKQLFKKYHDVSRRISDAVNSYYELSIERSEVKRHSRATFNVKQVRRNDHGNFLQRTLREGIIAEEAEMFIDIWEEALITLQRTKR